MKYFIILIFFIFTWSDVFGQLDTIRLSDMKSDNVLILGNLEDLIRLQGTPYMIDENRPFSRHRKSDFSTDIDTVFYFSSLTYTDTTFYDINTLTYYNIMSYIEKDGRVRLTYIDFEQKKDAVIYTPKLKLHRNLTLRELKRAYKYNKKHIGKVPGYVANFTHYISPCTYNVNFSIGKHERALIELVFDCNKKLRYMSIGAYDF